MSPEVGGTCSQINQVQEDLESPPGRFPCCDRSLRTGEAAVPGLWGSKSSGGSAQGAGLVLKHGQFLILLFIYYFILPH